MSKSNTISDGKVEFKPLGTFSQGYSEDVLYVKPSVGFEGLYEASVSRLMAVQGLLEYGLDATSKVSGSKPYNVNDSALILVSDVISIIQSMYDCVKKEN
ncbi:hypothetical protein [Pectobacterium sp. IFB5596]|uniref:hypothetical protein n=1 Tax=Pectobacterium sp. IFB5596 TaxID=1839803 RepID=UPI001F2F38F8|nr:hypothetical protein [Pectobacterium sp. IFB5596]MCE9733917.1 hypothetical protein [Pectobacterium sp. IFB5596]GKW13524.1 hypothetical protein PEC301899_38060 [Pectobacterium carotovorum subsp. carotovorum]